MRIVPSCCAVATLIAMPSLVTAELLPHASEAWYFVGLENHPDDYTFEKFEPYDGFAITFDDQRGKIDSLLTHQGSAVLVDIPTIQGIDTYDLGYQLSIHVTTPPNPVMLDIAGEIVVPEGYTNFYFQFERGDVYIRQTDVTVATVGGQDFYTFAASIPLEPDRLADEDIWHWFVWNLGEQPLSANLSAEYTTSAPEPGTWMLVMAGALVAAITHRGNAGRSSRGGFRPVV